MRYIGRHWRGEFSLLWSFWINLALLRAAILFAEQFTRPPFTDRSADAVAVAALFFTVFHLLVYPWQVVGVLRAADRHLKALGATLWAAAAHAGIIASLIVTGISIFSTGQSLLVEDTPPDMAAAWERERAGRYSLTYIRERRLLRLDGNIELGATAALEHALRQYPEVTGIVLESEGGNVYEGRGVARLIQRWGLDTYVTGLCKSACVTAFMGGATRHLGAGGRLGFHQYRLDAGFTTPFVDPAAEQERDRLYFASRQVAPDFLRRVFLRPHDEIWFPEPADLLAAGVVHRLPAAGANDR